MRAIIRIKRYSRNERLLMLIIGIVLGQGLLIEFFGLPSGIKYINDLVWTILLSEIMLNKFRMRCPQCVSLFSIVVIYFLITVVGFVLNQYSPLYYLWGFRNNFRFFVFFFACTLYLRYDSARDVLKLLSKVFYINFAVVLIQFFLLGKKMDYLGGIFGVQRGCNAKMMVLLCSFTAKRILEYYHREIGLSRFAADSLISVIIAALSELKMFIVMYVGIIALASLIMRFTWRKMTVSIATVILCYVGIHLLTLIYPNWSEIFSIERLLNEASSASGYTGRGGFNRLTTIPIILKDFLDTVPERLFGLGLGNCDTSTFSILNTPFFKRYSATRYNWFSSSFVMLETGFAGLVTYVAFFISTFLQSNSTKNKKNYDVQLCRLSAIMACVCIVLVIYNASMRIEEAYLAYFYMSLAFIKKDDKGSVRNNFCIQQDQGGM